jgi:hypothetical protein
MKFQNYEKLKDSFSVDNISPIIIPFVELDTSVSDCDLPLHKRCKFNYFHVSDSDQQVINYKNSAINVNTRYKQR